MNKFKNHLLIAMKQYNSAWSYPLVGSKNSIPTFLITLAIVAMMTSPMEKAAGRLPGGGLRPSLPSGRPAKTTYF
jgi:hypothetical protein